MVNSFAPNAYIKEVKVVSIIRIATLIGSGTAEDPTRDGFEYWDQEGNLLFVTEANTVHEIIFSPVKN